MSFEKRGVRPFDTLDETQKALSACLRVQSPPIPDGHQPPRGHSGLQAIGVKDGVIAGAGGTLVLHREQYLGAAIGLYFGVHDDDWRYLTDTVGKDLDNLFGRRGDAPVSVVTTLTNSRLKQTEVISSSPYDEWASGDWRHLITGRVTGTQRPRALRMAGDGCTLTVAFLLHDDVPKSRRVSGRPWRKGSWLARVEVAISAARDGGLAPRPLTEEIRNRFGLPTYTSSYVHVHGGTSGVHLVADLSEVLTVYIDEELLLAAAELDARNAHVHPGGGPLLNRWVLDTYRSLIMAYCKDDSLDEFDPEDDAHKRTFLYSMLQRVEDHCVIPVAEGLLVLKEDPYRFVALMEHVLGVRETDRELLQLRGPR